MMKKFATASMIIAGCMAAVSVSAQNQPTPEQQALSAVNARKSVVRLFSFNMAPINAMARGSREFDAALAERNALRIAALTPMLVETFAAMDTRPFPVETGALPIIWDNFAEFEQKAAALIQGANDFAALAATGSQQEVLAAVRAFGGNCGSCHDMFRAD